MRQRYRRLLPFILGVLLAFNLLQAVTDPTRGHWTGVSTMAAALAFILWYQARTDRPKGPPH